MSDFSWRALSTLNMGKEYPYHEQPPKDWAEQAACGVLFDLNDRTGMKDAFCGIDIEIRRSIVEAHAEIIRQSALAQSLTSEQVRDASTEYGWLVENGKQGDELRYRTWRDGMSDWTADHNEATRYCRRIDAERAHQEDMDAERIAEHAWCISQPAPTAEQSAVEEHRVPDCVWEALQRLIENGAALGKASAEDALVVAQWRARFVPARDAAIASSPSAAQEPKREMLSLADVGVGPEVLIALKIHDAERKSAAPAQPVTSLQSGDLIFQSVGWYVKGACDNWSKCIDWNDPANAEYIKSMGLTFKDAEQLYRLQPGQLAQPAPPHTGEVVAWQVVSDEDKLLGIFVELVFQCTRHESTLTDWKEAGRKFIAAVLASSLSAQQAPRVPDGWQLVPRTRSYEMRAAAFLHFNTAEQAGKDRDDAFEAAWVAQLAASPAPREREGNA